MDSRIIEWDGSHVPDELRALPPGRYVVEPLSAPLTAAELQGIREAMDEFDAGLGIPFEDAMREIDEEFADL